MWVRLSLAVALVAIAGCSWKLGLEGQSCEEDGAISEDGRRVCADGFWGEIGSGNGPGEVCDSNAACASGQCEDGTCKSPSCDDPVVNGTETGLNCGDTECGPGCNDPLLTCGACRAGERCQSDTDCWSRDCVGGTCREKTCDDGVRNGDETAVDCGGSECDPCGINEGCDKSTDCRTRNCAEPEGGGEAKCANPSCDDGAKNGSETDIDCGGDECGPCLDPGDGCVSDADCAEELFCDEAVAGGAACQLKQCDNGDRNTGETGVDCGGVCPRCEAGEPCDGDDDCQSNVCSDGVCEAGDCGDGLQNGNETDVDCGGSCMPCDAGDDCEKNRDCQSAHCGDDDTCVAPGCGDGVTNGEETDVDCGGTVCRPCRFSDRCEEDRDCVNDNCESNVCRPSCDDGIENHGETDVDCGGPNCGGCGAGKRCAGDDDDCESGWCRRDVCKVRISGELTAGDPGRWSNGTYAASCDDYESASGEHDERAYPDLDLSKEQVNRNGIYTIQPPGANQPYDVYCNLLRHNKRGGWTLVWISADDGQKTWTWDDKDRLTTVNPYTTGSPTDRSEDYMSQAYQDLTFEDLMFVFEGEEERWIAYDAVGDGSESVPSFIEAQGETCYGRNNDAGIASGFQKSNGNVEENNELCSTDLYFNAKDQNGKKHCNSGGKPENAYGPVWSAEANDDCPMDNPGKISSFGPVSDEASKEEDGRGFGKPLDIDDGNDRIEMFVR